MPRYAIIAVAASLFALIGCAVYVLLELVAMLATEEW